MIMLNDYWSKVHGKDINELIELPSGRVSKLEVEFLNYTENERCNVKIAELDNRLIGFMIYNYVFNSVLICRAIYFETKYRKRGLLRGLTMSVGKVTRVLSQTYMNNQPEEIKRETKRRVKINSYDGIDVWENILRS